MKHFLSIILTFINLISLAQNEVRFIEGIVTDSESTRPIPFAVIMNSSNQSGTLTNSDGYFRIGINNIDDEIFIQFVGYKKHNLSLKPNQSFYKVNLIPELNELNQIEIVPRDNDQLYRQLISIRKNQSQQKLTSKSYFELRSFREDQQIELVESYHNAEITGYTLQDLHLKTGRLALHQFQNRYFTTLDISHAILQLHLFESSEDFPSNPLTMSLGEMKKKYTLRREGKYVSGADSILVIRFDPRLDDGNSFRGFVWVNTARNHLEKLVLKCDSSKKYPFIPFTPDDSIASVRFDITIHFSSFQQQQLFNRINFIYDINYKSLSHTSSQDQFNIRSEAVLFAYNYEDQFSLPQIELNEIKRSDYRKIQAFPYNEFFWNHHNEPKLNYSDQSNEIFFADTNNITGVELFYDGVCWNKGFFEHPYVHWSGRPITFRSTRSDTSTSSQPTKPPALMYNLSVKTYFDVSEYDDSTNYLSSTIFDPFESYYHLPIDSTGFIFINLYFDLCEAERRKFQHDLETGRPSAQESRNMYNQFSGQLEATQQKFLRTVDRGTNSSEMIRWRKYVDDILDTYSP